MFFFKFYEGCKQFFVNKDYFYKTQHDFILTIYKKRKKSWILFCICVIPIFLSTPLHQSPMAVINACNCHPNVRRERSTIDQSVNVIATRTLWHLSLLRLHLTRFTGRREAKRKRENLFDYVHLSHERWDFSIIRGFQLPRRS